jgi:hypothetical protein
MYLLFGDEADRDAGPRAKFFIYGGVIIPCDQAPGLAREIEALRLQHGFRAHDSLKFASSTRPSRMDAEVHKEAKRGVIAAAGARSVRFCASVVLHELARRKSSEERVKHGANTILGAFNWFLEEADDHGVCCLDRLPISDPYSYLREKFQTGLTFPSGQRRRLDRIMSFSTSCDGASHLASVADVVLGSFRYCVNEPENDGPGRAMMPPLVSMMWHRRRGNRVLVRERGLILRPEEIRVPAYEAEYDRLVQRLMGYLQPQDALVPA